MPRPTAGTAVRDSAVTILVASFLVLPHSAFAANIITAFTAGDIVVSVEGNGSGTGLYLDNQAAPLTLYEYGVSGTSSASLAGAMMLPQTSSGRNYPISGEYGSSSEGTLQLSGNGQYLTIMGYGVNASAYNTTYDAGGTGTALAQSSSSAVPRVVALIGANGSVNTTTALTNVFNTNNPRSVYTTNGKTFLVSGQGTKGDSTSGVFSAALGATTAQAVTGNDSTYQNKAASQDTRVVQQYNGTTYVSIDSKTGTPNRGYIATVAADGTLAALPGMANGTVKLNGSNGNTVNNGTGTVNLSPDGFFFADSKTLYVADTGAPKAGSTLGDGGLQKWSLVNGSWVLDYTLSSGLNLVKNTASSGTTGLYALAGKVIDGIVDLYATNYTIGDTDPTYLYGITDVLANLTAPVSEAFTVLATAPADANFKGVSFSPTAVPLPAALPMFGAAMAGLGGLGLMRRRKAA